jgi:exopolysaccharide biosynthesis predicted pyruvyltransferase EpsI
MTGFRVLSFGYRYPEYKEIETWTHIDGSPLEFLKLVDQAAVVFTDSFHATIFSLILHKPFYVFSRRSRA